MKIALAQLGWVDGVCQYYCQMMPLARQDNDQHQVKPYVYCSNIDGPTNPQFGHGRNAWLTRIASWMFVTATQWMLGIRPTFRGLQIAPAILSSWPGFRARKSSGA